MSGGSLQAAPRLDQWLRFDADGSVAVLSGKVEIGQGLLTALAQVVADELGLPLAQVRATAACTGTHPDEGVTSGSLSLQHSGQALRQVCREVRALREAHGGSYAQLQADGLLARAATGAALPAPPALHVGQPLPRLDIPDKLAGRFRYLHDLAPAGLLHGRVLRPPNLQATPRAADLDAVRTLPGVQAVLQDGRQFGLLAATGAQADAALARLEAAVRWDAPEALPDEAALRDWLLRGPHETTVVAERGPVSGPSDAPGVARTLVAEYRRPFVAHAAMGPSAALACWQDGRLQVWSHTQGPYNLRRDLALAFGLAEEAVVVQHVQGPGCYGHNGADDVAWDAAWLARQVPGRPVRVQWSRAQEFTEAPFGPAGLARIEAALDAQGRIVRWSHALWSPGHSSRPGRAPTPTLLGSWCTAQPFPVLPAVNVGAAMGGGADRNAVPGYAIPALRVVAHRVLDPAIRGSALRSLGALLNVVAIEGCMDELAALAGSDPLTFRLRHLEEARGRAVLARAVARSGWMPGAPGGEGQGWGLGYARYKGTGAWCAVLAQVEVAERVRVRRLVVEADLGLVVNPDGAVAQLEGGAIQATSVALLEAVRFDRRGITSRDWEGYPILRFSDVPAVDVGLADSREPSLGAGEASFGPTAAAIVNAVAQALGVRVRELPLTPERIRAAIEAAG
jgi:CO/xanthine dehydrogenase Mo-binding subunit